MKRKTKSARSAVTARNVSAELRKAVNELAGNAIVAFADGLIDICKLAHACELADAIDGTRATTKERS